MEDKDKLQKIENLTEQDIYNAFQNGLENYDLQDKRIIVLIPDSTRSGPYHQLTRILIKILKPIVKKISDDLINKISKHLQPGYNKKIVKEIIKVIKNNINRL